MFKREIVLEFLVALDAAISLCMLDACQVYQKAASDSLPLTPLPFARRAGWRWLSQSRIAPSLTSGENES
jgi:hypothetical protein